MLSSREIMGREGRHFAAPRLEGTGRAGLENRRNFESDRSRLQIVLRGGTFFQVGNEALIVTSSTERLSHQLIASAPMLLDTSPSRKSRITSFYLRDR